ncbi:hypothetical protein [Chthonomonas calidirosea]|uniref:hypothetical protein n=1 Tax=Chthonomonas calidirosea TaxID=454171 RepID=UPI0003A1ED57|nr:hypothetical protein [Chthonomonas calidirosea]
MVQDNDNQAKQLPPGPPLAPGAICARCGHTDVIPFPTFSIGSGISRRPWAEDVFCRRCGHIGLPRFPDDSSQNYTQDINKESG